MAKLKCIECGEQFEDTQKACPNCGCPTETMWLCPECGTTYDASQEACPECACPTLLQNEIYKQGLYACDECGTFYPIAEKACPNCGCPTAQQQQTCPECLAAYDSKLLECPNCGCINESIDSAIIQKIAEKDQQELQELAAERRILEEHHLLNLRHAAKGADVSHSIIKSLARTFLRFDNFSGRARRSEFWTFVAFNIIIGFVLSAVLLACIGRDYITISLAETESEYLYLLFSSCLTRHLVITSIIILYLLITVLPFISLTVRRLHDTNRSGKWLLLAVVPYILGYCFNFTPYWGIALLAVMLLLDSVPDNKWGHKPHRA